MNNQWIYFLIMPLSGLFGVLGTIVTQHMTRRTTSGSVNTSDAATVFTNLQGMVEKQTRQIDALYAHVDKQDTVIAGLRERLAVAEHRADKAEYEIVRIQSKCITPACANYIPMEGPHHEAPGA